MSQMSQHFRMSMKFPKATWAVRGVKETPLLRKITMRTAHVYAFTRMCRKFPLALHTSEMMRLRDIRGMQMLHRERVNQGFFLHELTYSCMKLNSMEFIFPLHDGMCGTLPYELFPIFTMMDNDILPLCKMLCWIKQVG